MRAPELIFYTNFNHLFTVTVIFIFSLEVSEFFISPKTTITVRFYWNRTTTLVRGVGRFTRGEWAALRPGRQDISRYYNSWDWELPPKPKVDFSQETHSGMGFLVNIFISRWLCYFVLKTVGYFRPSFNLLEATAPVPQLLHLWPYHTAPSTKLVQHYLC